MILKQDIFSIKILKKRYDNYFNRKYSINKIYLFWTIFFTVFYAIYEILFYVLQFDFCTNNSYKFLYVSKNNVIVFEKSYLMLIVDLFRIIYCLLCNAMIIIILYYLSNVITGYAKHNRSINNLIFTYKLLGYAALYIFWIITQYGSNNFCCNINTHHITLYKKFRIIYTLIMLEIKSVTMMIISIYNRNINISCVLNNRKWNSGEYKIINIINSF